MIITRTPFRISFVGGGTDIEKFYSYHKGAVISTTINKYMYISSNHFFDPEMIRLKYSRTETVSSRKEIEHPLLRAVMDHFNIEKGIEISSLADIISNTGMGSSSSFTVGLLQNLAHVRKVSYNKEDLASIAYDIENSRCGSIGKQDQYAASYGGLNLIEFLPNNKVNVIPIRLRVTFQKELNKRLMLFYVGTRKISANQILDQQVNEYHRKEKKKLLVELSNLVYDFQKALMTEDFDSIGSILHESWLLKKSISSVSNPIIDELYETGLKYGASGGKLLGAGLGGFMLFYCEPESQEKLRSVLNTKYRQFNFSFEDKGSQVIFEDI